MKLIIIALVVYLSLNLSETQADDEWEQWKKNNNKVYSNGRGVDAESEDVIRKGIFEKNLQKIKDFNKKNSTFKLGLNEYSDLSEDEFKQRFNANIDINIVKKNIKHANITDFSKGRIISDSVNWVTSGYVAPILHQGQCGSCYSFASIAAIESAYAIKYGLRYNVKSFSQQQLLDCSYYKYSFDGSVGNLGCSGGYLYHSLYYASQYGIQLASSYPYVDNRQTCKYSSSKVVTKVTGIYTASNNVGAINVNAMKAAVSKQPVTVYIYADNFYFLNYKSDIYTGPNCQNSKTSCPLGTNHAVTIVGYGSENGVPFWRVRNSWGTTWGESGYFRIAMGINACCIEGFFYYPTVY